MKTISPWFAIIVELDWWWWCMCGYLPCCRSWIGGGRVCVATCHVV